MARAILQKLEKMSIKDSIVSRQDFMDLCKDVMGSKKGIWLAQLCYERGFVSRYGDGVYTSIRPIQEAARKLPLDPPRLKRLLAEAQSQIVPLESLKRDMDYIAYVQTRRLFRVGFMTLFFQCLLFMQLTFVELSWDVMEPVAYFTTMSIALFSYACFLMTNKKAKFAQVHQSMVHVRQFLLYQKAGVNLELYENLSRRIRMYEDSLKSFDQGQT